MGLLSRIVGRERDRRPGSMRVVVVDTETTGLDAERDALLAIGAVAAGDDGIDVGDSFECQLRNEHASPESNVVVHGIGHEAQRRGEDPAQALARFAAYAGDAPFVAFHADFDRRVLQRAFAQAAIEWPQRRWLDLDPLASLLLPGALAGKRSGSLDDWCEALAIDVTERHNASGDALATAELLLRLRAVAASRGVRGFAGLERLVRDTRWLTGV